MRLEVKKDGEGAEVVFSFVEVLNRCKLLPDFKIFQEFA
jgi:hypothetical protein